MKTYAVRRKIMQLISHQHASNTNVSQVQHRQGGVAAQTNAYDLQAASKKWNSKPTRRL